jgi:hypothetical protein
MVFAINLERVFFINQVLNLLVDNEHQLLIYVYVAIVLFAATSAFKISFFCYIKITILWRLDHLLFGTLSARGSSATHHKDRFSDSKVESFLALEALKEVLHFYLFIFSIKFINK